MAERADVAIVGGGPAGAAAGITLAGMGASVLVIDRSADRPSIGEGLSPGSVPILQDLGVWEEFLTDDHRPAHGNRSVWGSERPEEHDFLRSPFGAGWHIDRPRFDALLLRALARAGGATSTGTRAVECRVASGGGRDLVLQAAGARGEVHADVVIDASGRARWLARALNVRRRVYDRLIAIVGLLAPSVPGADRDSFTSVEAAGEGWWFASLLPDGRLVAGYLTDTDLASESGARTSDGWTALLRQTTEMHDRIAACGYRLCGPLRVMAADSSCLETMAGDGWYAVGDAAAAHDPLSAQGLSAALSSGIAAARAIGGMHPGGSAGYGDQMQEAYAGYLARWLATYDIERRWPESPFWKRRHSLFEALLSGAS